jgi:hypothetical protein
LNLTGEEKMIDRLYIKEKEIFDILPPFKKIRVYSITSKKTGIDIQYFPTELHSLKDVQKTLEKIEGQYFTEFLKIFDNKGQ